MAGSAGYSGTPLPRKLGIQDGSTVVLVSAPEQFEKTLGKLPPRTTLRRRNRGAREITIWFVTSSGDLARRFDAIARAVGEGTLWVAWSKQSSDMAATSPRTPSATSPCRAVWSTARSTRPGPACD